MNRSIRRIVIKGGYGLGNFGDDALMVAVYEIVARIFDPKFIELKCHNVGYIQRLIPGVKAVALNNERHKKVDLLIYGGGTQFYSFPLTNVGNVPSFNVVWRNLKKPIHAGTKIVRKVRRLTSQNINARKIIALGIGLGPFVKNSTRLRECYKIIRQMEYVAVRDTHSYELCEKWGCNNLSLRSDLCYLPNLWTVHKQNLHQRSSMGIIRRIGIIPRDWPHTYEGDSYTFPLFQVVDELRSVGKKVEFILFARSDHNWSERLKNRGEQYITWNPENSTITEFIEQLASYDAFITARYHGAVFASILGKPVICIEIEQKLRLLSDLLGHGSRLWSYPFDASLCLKYILDLERDHYRSLESLNQMVQKQGALAKIIVDELGVLSMSVNDKDMY